ncbi:iron chelate uptake ABC transporter family permease subunit [Corynebacterium sp. zg254]|uniref:Iron chelate uptake ABC transporter family permease subunit n=1 Tax=Corynebacterium zhongnanshanii TaxID=2768834 RepID=A0ABQ6VC48_9CORY|nr:MULTISPECIES: iron chelate uptake ABC transporter family permease subunit [Corynebacterium]KAB3519139.1 iron chelate uptake ABC transporter family permease subunit [Corynebacterium zhongnanshanii]MCR5914979.1 iron chelate uptake ABC transporter family permease subunit [Corynebacterium sp. zg254]
MDQPPSTTAVSQASHDPAGDPARVSVPRALVVVLGAVLLLATCVASMVWGSSHIPLADVWHYLRYPDNSVDSYNINGLRGSRTIIGIAVGVSLAVAGAIMQAITRNPLADPGLLGVNSGASLAIVLGSAYLGLTAAQQQFFVALVGALLATVFVYAVGSAGGTGASPVRLILAGVAFSAAAGGIIGAIQLAKPDVFDSFRFWEVGSLTRMDVPLVILWGPIVVGLALSVLLIRGLSNIALGDDAAAALGTNVTLTRAVALVAITVLCASATAAAGPLSYVGLVVPIVAQWLMGPHRGWIIALCVVLGPCLVLAADIIGRLLARPTEMSVGLLTAFVGAPMLLLMVHRMRGDGR